jgi:glycosyltransferase involved in cell wall biosynthesis
MGPGYRGYHEFIVPAAAAVDRVELLTAAREDKWRGPEEMLEFYRALDVYVCASRAEGTPNTCLEAAACGVPLLTTCVGNMPELVVEGVNGFFVERDLDEIARKLQLLRDDANLRTAMSTQIQHDIQAWDWSLRSQAYRRMFEEMVSKAEFSD